MLVCWLPLTDDLHNHGLGDVTVTNIGATRVANGKIGGCYQFGTSASYMSLPANTMTDFTECSVTMWLKIIAFTTNYDTYFQAGLGSTPWTHYIFGLLRNTNNNLVFAISNGSSGSQGSYVYTGIELNKWYHIVLTYKAGHCCMYIDGKLFNDWSASIVPAFDKITHITIGKCNSGSAYQSNCLINDFRIYDEAISPKHVAELAKGLVAHYTLSRGGADNVLKNSANLTNLWHLENATATNGIATINATGSGNRRIYQMPADGEWGIWKANTTYTVSVDAKTDNSNIKLSFQPYAAGVSMKNYSCTSNWKRYSYTFTSNSNTSTASCSFFLGKHSNMSTP